jgi:thiamine monophosphate kinase
MVVERLVVAPDLKAKEDAPTSAFVASLALPGLPQTNLAALYGALVERCEGLAVARIIGGPFQIVKNAAAVDARRVALEQYGQVEADWLAVRAAIRREKRLAQQVELGNQARELKDRLQAIAGELAEAPDARR